MTQINPYLTFNGNCRQAMTFYHECLGGELKMMTMKETPMAAQIPPEAQNNIMHANLQNGAIVLLASDGMGTPLVSGNTNTISISCDTEEEINRFFNNLSSGGQVTMPLAKQFWGGIFGMFTDKFGMNWMLNCEQAPAQ